MPTKFDIAKITSKGQVTVPKAIRDYLGVEPGDHLAFVKQPDGTVRVCMPAIAALDIAREAFANDPAVQAEGLETIDDVVAMIKEMRERGEI